MKAEKNGTNFPNPAHVAAKANCPLHTVGLAKGTEKHSGW